MPPLSKPSQLKQRNTQPERSSLVPSPRQTMANLAWAVFVDATPHHVKELSMRPCFLRLPRPLDATTFHCASLLREWMAHGGRLSTEASCEGEAPRPSVCPNWTVGRPGPERLHHHVV
jgi:hypothetical protein